mgnify:CR=1 FL=1
MLFRSVGMACRDVDAELARLRRHGVVAIARDANVVLDLRSVEPVDDARLIAALLP